MRHAVLTPFFGQLRDRYCDYHAPLPLAEKLRRARSVPGVEGVEIVFPDEVRAAEDVRDDLEALGLEVAAVNVNLKGERIFQRGALTSPDAGVRARAVDLLCQAKQLARDLSTPRITCAPLADGYDYPLQIDYRLAWSRMVEAVARAGAYMPEIALHLEHKPAEPRTRALLDVPAKVLRLCRDTRLSSVGITFNVGHAQAGGGCPAASFAEVLAADVPYYVHFCDATPGWDWDLKAGSHHLWQWAELLFYLMADGYQGWITADTFPVRQEAVALHASNVSVTNAICRWLERLDRTAVETALQRQCAMPMLKELEEWVPRCA
jgi:xylose isomerase